MEPQKVQTYNKLLNDKEAEHLPDDRNKLDLDGRIGLISHESSSKQANDNVDNYREVDPTPEVVKRMDDVDLACEAHNVEIIEELFRDIEPEQIQEKKHEQAENLPEYIPEDNNRRVDVDLTSLSSPSNEAPNHPTHSQQMPNHRLARNTNKDPKGKQVVQEENQNHIDYNQNIQPGYIPGLDTLRLFQQINQKYSNSENNLINSKGKQVVQEEPQNHINFNQNLQQGYNPGLDTEKFCQQINQRYNNAGFGPTASTLYYPHNYGQMGQHTMLHTQQNYNTNYLNNNSGHSIPPIASEPVVQPSYNQNLNKKRVQFSEGTFTKNNHEGTSKGKKRKTRKNPTEKNHEIPVNLENNAENNNNSNNSLDNQNNVVEDFPNIFEPKD
uniref:Uncharacterized protein n=1 Tax=Meloidogyne javanica TaxID=6303 RepID=A0A915LIU4_MELJA